MTLEEVLGERLTEDKVAEALEANAEKLIAAGMAVDESNLRYIKLNKYEIEKNPENYKNIKISSDIYAKYPTKTASDVLEELDPSYNYEDTELKNLSAFERQMKRLGIKVGEIWGELQWFFDTPEGKLLFPEFVRIVMEKLSGCHIEKEFAALCDLFMHIEYSRQCNRIDMIMGRGDPDEHID